MKIIRKLKRLSKLRRKRFITIIESPYSAPSKMGVDENVLYALKCCRDSYERGEAPFASHLFYTRFMNDNIQKERADGIGFGLTVGEMLAEKAVFYVDRGISEGMRNAVKRWESVGVDIEYRRLGNG